MFCSKCGGKIDDGVKFCPGCGTPASSGVNLIQAQPAVSPVSVVSLNQNNGASIPQNISLDKKPKNKFNISGIISFALCALSIIVCITFVCMVNELFEEAYFLIIGLLLISFINLLSSIFGIVSIYKNKHILVLISICIDLVLICLINYIFIITFFVELFG